MGRTTERVSIINYNDVSKFEEGLIKESEIRKTEINAVVDTGAPYLCLPPKVINKLGLKYAFKKLIKTGNGSTELRIFRSVEIIIKDRSILMQVMENKDDSIPPLIGYLVLEEMDWVVNPKTQKIIGNPDHDGKWVIDMY